MICLPARAQDIGYPQPALSNRAAQALRSPGSTFKIVIAAAALEEGLVTPEFRAQVAAAQAADKDKK